MKNGEYKKQRMVDLRTAQGITQSELAEKLQVCMETVSRAERGVIVSTKYLRRFAEHFEIDWVSLLVRDAHKKVR